MKFKIVKPCVTVSKGKAVHHLKAGGTVDLDESDAKSLVADGKLKATSEPKAEPKPDKPEPKSAD